MIAFTNHSFGLIDSSRHIVATTTFNNQQVASIIRKDNIVGIQFHPEKVSKQVRIYSSPLYKINVLKTYRRNYSCQDEWAVQSFGYNNYLPLGDL